MLHSVRLLAVVASVVVSPAVAAVVGLEEQWLPQLQSVDEMSLSSRVCREAR
jgi:hypothetical protein